MKLTRKQKAFADGLLANPKLSATEIATQTYQVKNRNVANNIAAENLAKPSIQIYLESHGDKALQDNLEIAEYSKDMGKTFSREGASYASVASDINKDILNRVLGKPTQRIESTSTVVEISLNLSDVADTQ